MLLNYSLAKTSSSIIYYKYFNIVVWLCFLNWFLLNLARKTLGILFYAIQKSYKGSIDPTDCGSGFSFMQEDILFQVLWVWYVL